MNVGQLLGKWRFPLNEGVKRWLRRSEFYEMVEDKKNFTPCLMFKYEGEGFSTSIQHLRWSKYGTKKTATLLIITLVKSEKIV